ncbi:MAG: TauD/TfdA family dioxygenase [Acidimicrobiales bacterium]|nr:TauD/TfdA family dioxygenase [Acidimicrobiales bacterium]
MTARHHLELPAVGLWRGGELGGIDRLAVDLDDVLLTDLQEAALVLAAAGANPSTLAADDLPLGPLGPVLDDLRQTLLDDRGIALVRGLPVGRLPVNVVELMFLGIGLGLGTPESQSVMGEVVGHVTDVTDTDPHARAYRDRSKLSPHTDLADLFSLLCVRPARTGGVNRFVSALSVHEEIRRQRPDLLERLYRGFRYHRFGEEGPGQEPITPHRVPVFSARDGMLSCRYVRQFIDMAADEDPGSALTDEDIEALDMLEETAARIDLRIEHTLAPGEAVVANNYTVLHSRTAFEDHANASRRRLLLRLWLSADPPRPVVEETRLHDTGQGIAFQPGRTPSYATSVGTR